MSYWVNESVFYHIYPIGFCGAPRVNDGETVCRLDKVIDWIPHLKSMSVNAIYFGPVFKSTVHGYDTDDYRVIDNRLGTNESFKHICDELHKNGIKVVLDGVFNAMNLLHWSAMKLMKERGVKYYDFVGARINPDEGSKYEGIQRFKSRFGGELKKGYLWKMPLNKFKYKLFCWLVAAKQGRNYCGDVIDQERKRGNY